MTIEQHELEPPILGALGPRERAYEHPLDVIGHEALPQVDRHAITHHGQPIGRGNESQHRDPGDQAPREPPDREHQHAHRHRRRKLAPGHQTEDHERSRDRRRPKPLLPMLDEDVEPRLSRRHTIRTAHIALAQRRARSPRDTTRQSIVRAITRRPLHEQAAARVAVVPNQRLLGEGALAQRTALVDIRTSLNRLHCAATVNLHTSPRHPTNPAAVEPPQHIQLQAHLIRIRTLSVLPLDKFTKRLAAPHRPLHARARCRRRINTGKPLVTLVDLLARIVHRAHLPRSILHAQNLVPAQHTNSVALAILNQRIADRQAKIEHRVSARAS